MTWEELIRVIIFAVTIGGVSFGIWWRIEGRIDRRHDEAMKVVADMGMSVSFVRAELAAHKLHVAETYVTKAGMQEQTATLMRAIEGVGNRIEALNDRLDRAFEHRS